MLTLLLGISLLTQNTIQIPKNQIISNYEYINEIGEREVKYFYFDKNNTVPIRKKEVLEERVLNGYTLHIGGKIREQKRFAYPIQYKYKNVWYEVKGATSTLQDFNSLVKNNGIISTAYAQSQTQGSALIISTSTGVAWGSPMNAQTSDNVRSITDSISDTNVQQMIYATNWSFIFGPATILGIQVKWETSYGSSIGSPIIKDAAVRVVGCGAESSNKPNATNWTTTDVTRTYGGSNDMWGLSCTDTQVRSDDFGTQLRPKCTNCGGGTVVRGRADYVEMTVWYELTVDLPTPEIDIPRFHYIEYATIQEKKDFYFEVLTIIIIATIITIGFHKRD